MGKVSVLGFLTIPTESFNLRVGVATGVSCSSIQRIARGGRKHESIEDALFKPFEEESKRKRTDLVLDEFAADVVRRTVHNFCITEKHDLTRESLRTELQETIDFRSG
jgi:hypothetical protein